MYVCGIYEEHRWWGVVNKSGKDREDTGLNVLLGGVRRETRLYIFAEERDQGLCQCVTEDKLRSNYDDLQRNMAG